jgi:hypothetical protein
VPVGEALTAWHLTASGSPAALDDFQCQQAGYLIAAAADRGLEASFISKVRLDRVLAIIGRQPLSALEALP